MVTAQKFVRNVYYHELVRSLRNFGYRVQNHPRGDFDIEGISPELVKRFSKRHEEIDQKTKKLLEREPDKASQNIKVNTADRLKAAGKAAQLYANFRAVGWDAALREFDPERHTPKSGVPTFGPSCVNWANQCA